MRIKTMVLLLVIWAKANSQVKVGPLTEKFSINTWEVIINEIMADPDPAAGGNLYPEYVELYNKKDVPVHLKNWKFCTGAACKTLPDVFIEADSFIVLTTATSKSSFPVDVKVIGINGFPALTNTGQTLQLQNETGNTIAVVSYTDDWYKNVIKKEGGYSLEQMDPLNPCGEEHNWKASVNSTGGTPGKINSVIEKNSDSKPPEILRLNVLSSQQLEVSFTESLDSTTLLDESTYQISDIGNPIQVIPVKPHFKSITLYLAIPLKEAVMYTLSIQAKITDCVGNVISKNNRARFAMPAEILKNDLVINEILFDPHEGGVDFLEIYNASQKVVDLKSLYLCHYDTITGVVSEIGKISSAGHLFFPGEYLVLTEQVETIKQQYRTEDPEAFLKVTNLPTLSTDEGNICLKTAANFIDHFTYNANMHFALLKDTKGISLERVHFRRLTNDVTNWHSASSSVGFATPGYKNSQFVENPLSEKTISVYPEVFSPNGDGFNDQVSIYYQFDEPEWSATILIYDSRGRPVRTLVNNELIGAKGSYSWDGINDNREKERMGIYIIYMSVFNLSGMIKQYKKVCVLSGKP